MDAAAAWSTRANALTLLRLLLAPAFALAVLHGAPSLAAAIFALAIATDLADGWVARRYGEATPFGGFADHAADAVFVSVGAAALAAAGALPAPLPFLIALAFAQYALDSRARTDPDSRAGPAPDSRPPPAPGLRPSRLGRWNGLAYYAIVALPVVRDALALAWPDRGLVRALGWALVATTLLSMADRAHHRWGARRS